MRVFVGRRAPSSYRFEQNRNRSFRNRWHTNPFLVQLLSLFDFGRWNSKIRLSESQTDRKDMKMKTVAIDAMRLCSVSAVRHRSDSERWHQPVARSGNHF